MNETKTSESRENLNFNESSCSTFLPYISNLQYPIFPMIYPNIMPTQFYLPYGSISPFIEAPMFFNNNGLSRFGEINESQRLSLQNQLHSYNRYYYPSLDFVHSETKPIRDQNNNIIDPKKNLTSTMAVEESPSQKRIRTNSLTILSPLQQIGHPESINFEPKAGSGKEEEPSNISGSSDSGTTANLTQPSELFKKGTRIQLQNGEKRLVEHLTTEDFLKSSGASPDYDIISAKVSAIKSYIDVNNCNESGHHANMAQIDFLLDTSSANADQDGLFITSNKAIEMVVLAGHLFFVPDKDGQPGGWASVNPEISYNTFGTVSRQLCPGDCCLILLAKNKDLVENSSSSIADHNFDPTNPHYNDSKVEAVSCDASRPSSHTSASARRLNTRFRDSASYGESPSSANSPTTRNTIKTGISTT